MKAGVLSVDLFRRADLRIGNRLLHRSRQYHGFIGNTDNYFYKI